MIINSKTILNGFEISLYLRVCDSILTINSKKKKKKFKKMDYSLCGKQCPVTSNYTFFHVIAHSMACMH